MLDFGLTEEQEHLRETVRAVMQRYAPAEELRRLDEDEVYARTARKLLRLSGT